MLFLLIITTQLSNYDFLSLISSHTQQLTEGARGSWKRPDRNSFSLGFQEFCLCCFTFILCGFCLKSFCQSLILLILFLLTDCIYLAGLTGQFPCHLNREEFDLPHQEGLFCPVASGRTRCQILGITLDSKFPITFTPPTCSKQFSNCF